MHNRPTPPVGFIYVWAQPPNKSITSTQTNFCLAGRLVPVFCLSSERYWVRFPSWTPRRRVFAVLLRSKAFFCRMLSADLPHAYAQTHLHSCIGKWFDSYACWLKIDGIVFLCDLATWRLANQVRLRKTFIQTFIDIFHVRWLVEMLCCYSYCR